MNKQTLHWASLEQIRPLHLGSWSLGLLLLAWGPGSGWKPRWYLLGSLNLPPPTSESQSPCQHPTREQYAMDQMQLSLPEG